MFHYFAALQIKPFLQSSKVEERDVIIGIPGPRTSNEDLVDYSIAVLQNPLVVRMKTSTTPFTDPYHRKKFFVPTPSFSETIPVLHGFCNTSVGYQRVAFVRSSPASNLTQQNFRKISVEVILYSVGYGKTLASLEESIYHQLDEVHLPDLDHLGPEASCIKRLEVSMPGM
ncbi:hypothetical protein Aperf_G00000072654 [Anoplocephala perfoliata]